MKNDFLSQKLVNRADLSDLERPRTTPLIWTNGCFDIVHSGHISYLYECKKLGGDLIIGINSDDSVRRLKGVSRPINSLNDRILHLAAFFFVDKIIVFDEDTPLNWIRKIQPDILVKGGDYVIEDIVGYEEVQTYGGRVLTIPLVEGKSTSSLITKILDLHDKN